jgi:hypothetical protein
MNDIALRHILYNSTAASHMLEKAAAELERLGAIEAAARDLLTEFAEDGKYGDGTQGWKTTWDYARDSRINALAALSPQPGVIGDEKG